ncbi:MAG: hypothetical protein AB8G16_19430 [Gammaproteobacteria bacterium]
MDGPASLDDAIEMLSSKNADEVANGLLFIADVATKNSSRGFESSISAANSVVLGPGGLRSLQETLKSWVENHPGDENLSSAFWALGKFSGKDFVPFLKDALAGCIDERKEGADTMYQILIALDNLGERVLPNGGLSSFEHDKNVEIARVYLRRCADDA